MKLFVDRSSKVTLKITITSQTLNDQWSLIVISTLSFSNGNYVWEGISNSNWLLILNNKSFLFGRMLVIMWQQTLWLKYYNLMMATKPQFGWRCYSKQKRGKLRTTTKHSLVVGTKHFPTSTHGCIKNLL